MCVVKNPDVLAGKLVISGTRISIELILDCLASGWSITEFIENYPRIAQKDVLAALSFAANVMRMKPFFLQLMKLRKAIILINIELVRGM
ncbi:DUF433 domain-containing protein [Nitrosomonas sp. Nm132]|uniref:DUF433 domain-containing protein n=1 Tax=Nitrosomonas sp. Nm132 TaxID=1881053 RepID=UPI000B816586